MDGIIFNFNEPINIAQKKYIISENFEEKNSKGNSQYEIITSSNNIELLSKNGIKFNLVNEDFLESKKIEKSLYKDKDILYFEIDNKMYLLFKHDNRIIEKKKF